MTRLGRFGGPAEHTHQTPHHPERTAVSNAMTFQVRVLTTGMGDAGSPQFEHLVDVVTDGGATEAMLIATQMAACRIDALPGNDNDHLMPLAAEIVTDSTFTDF